MRTSFVAGSAESDTESSDGRSSCGYDGGVSSWTGTPAGDSGCSSRVVIDRVGCWLRKLSSPLYSTAGKHESDSNCAFKSGAVKGKRKAVVPSWHSQYME